MNSVNPAISGRLLRILPHLNFAALALMACCFSFSFALFNIGVAILCISFILRRVIARDFKPFDPFLDCALFLYLIIAAISFFQSHYPELSLQGIQKLFRYLLLFAAAREALTDAAKAPLAVRLFLIGGAIAGIDSLIQFMTGQDLLARQTPSPGLNDLIRLTGPFANPNTLAIYLVYFPPIFYLMFRSAVSRKQQIIWGVLLAAVLAALAMTYSRPAATALALSAFFLMILKKDFWIPGAGILLLAAGIFLAPGDIREWVMSLESWQGFFQDSSRNLHHQAAWNMISQHFFLGAGLNTFDVNYAAYRAPGDVISRWSAHQAYLQIWAETGLAGLISFLMIPCGIIFFVVRALKKTTDVFIKNSILGFSLGVLSFFIIGFFESSFWQPRQTYFFWLWAGFLCNLGSLHEKTHTL